MRVPAVRFTLFYRWMLGIIMMVYCFLLARFAVDQSIDQDQITTLKYQLKRFKESSLWERNTKIPVSRNVSDFGLSTTLYPRNTPKGRSNATENATASIVSQGKNQPKRRKLQEKLDAIFLESGNPYNGDLWEISDYVPQWMKDYFRWHREERKKLTKDTWDSQTRVLVMQCLRGSDDKCGGTADRLKSFLLMVREAHASQRLLLIHWTLPARLEEFLLPPAHGIDWRVPDWLSEILHSGTYPGRMLFRVAALEKFRGDRNITLLRTRVQSITGGAEYYDKELMPDEASFDEVYHDVWRIFFTPSAPVRANIESYMEKWNLSPGEYAAAHLRALYARVVERTDAEATEWAQNAINCASTLRPGGPFVFSSDHSFSTQAALDYGEARGTIVVARPHERTPLHIDNADDLLERKPSEFYDLFIDLYLMGMSRCLTYNRGGFGQWALMIGYDSTCFHNQKTSSLGIGAPCNWTKPDVLPRLKKRSKAPLFLPPMIDEAPAFSQHRKLTNLSQQLLPTWMTDYFAWHHETKSNLNIHNWNQTKYLVMTCQKNSTCGGISDRLKTLPFVVLQAARHKRLLFIDWKKPKPLEEFLVPPSGGVDWRMPDWLRKHLRTLPSDITYGCDDCNRKLYIQANDILIRLRIQTSDAGEAFYAAQPDSYSTYADVFHGLFRVFFTPVPRIQEKIDQKLEEHGLVPGQYAAVHLRNLYGKRQWRHPHETIALAVNGINCASRIFPGAKIFYASDDKFAVDAARAYGQQRNLPVGSSDFIANPIHIDKDDGWTMRTAADFDDTFVDLYMLGQSRCVAYSNGGYGTFGSLLSYDSHCNIRYFRGRKIPRNCTWTDAHHQRIPLDPPEMDIPPEMYIAPS